MSHPPRKGDLPRDEIMKKANDVILELHGKAQVFFKFTCPACGERCAFREPNKLYEIGICDRCGHEAPVQYAGFSLFMTLDGQ